MSQRPLPETRDAFSHFEKLSTRWNDNDIYAHMYNGVYYQLYDTAIHNFLLREGVLDLAKSTGIFVMVSNGSDFFSELAFPDSINAGLRVERIGNSSVSYKIALFRGDAQTASAHGRVVHVYVNKATRKPQNVPENLRIKLLKLT